MYLNYSDSRLEIMELENCPKKAKKTLSVCFAAKADVYIGTNNDLLN